MNPPDTGSTASPAAPAGADFPFETVPVTARRSPWAILTVFVGFIIVAGQMAVGGGLASKLPFDQLVLAVLLGNLISGLFAVFAGYTGALSGRSFALMTRDAFPGWSGRVAQMYVPLVLIGWYAIETAIFASILAVTFGLPESVEPVLAFFSAALFASATYVGFRGMRWVGVVAVPLMLLLGSYAIVHLVANGEGRFGFDEVPLTFPSAVAIVVGSWIMGALTALPDLTRFAKSARAGAVIGFVGIFVANSFNHLVGAAGAGLAGEADPARILATLGLAIPGLLFAVANIWTTNDGNLYSASLNAAVATGWTRTRAVALCAALAGVIAMFHPQNISSLFTFLLAMNVTAPPLAAVVLGRFWFERRGWIRGPARPWHAWAGCITGTAVGVLSGQEWSFLSGTGAALLVFWICTRFFGTVPMTGEVQQ
jgi:cytosine permease